MVKIGFAGDGWGAVSAIRSLREFFIVECLSGDTDVISELSSNDVVIDLFKGFSSKFIVCAGYKPIISSDLIKKHTILNVHYSLLPMYRGLHSVAWAIMNGEKNLGWTVHIMSKYIDDGPIVYQKRISNDNESSASYFMDKMNTQVALELGGVVSSYIKGEIEPIEQDKNKASWVGKRSLKHNIINFNEGFKYCKRLFRVLQFPYPGPQIIYKGCYYNVGKVCFHKSHIKADNSRILNVDEEGVWVKSEEGYIILSDITFRGETIDFFKFNLGSYLNDRSI